MELTKSRYKPRHFATTGFFPTQAVPHPQHVPGATWDADLVIVERYTADLTTALAPVTPADAGWHSVGTNVRAWRIHAGHRDSLPTWANPRSLLPELKQKAPGITLCGWTTDRLSGPLACMVPYPCRGSNSQSISSPHTALAEATNSCNALSITRSSSWLPQWGCGGNSAVARHRRVSTPAGPRYRTVKVNGGLNLGAAWQRRHGVCSELT